MKISQIQGFQKKLNNNYAHEKGMPYSTMSMPNVDMTYANGIQNSLGNYGKAQVMMNHSPSFKAFGLDDLFLILVALY